MFAITPTPPLATNVLDPIPAVIFALIGSAVVVIFNFVKYANLPPAQRPSLNDPLYWVVQIVLNPILALIAAFACIYGNQPLTSFTAIALGAGAPAFLQRVIDSFVPQPVPPSKPPGA